MRWCLLGLFTLILGAKAWDDGDLEVFDVVEEVNQNFYELLGVTQVGAKFSCTLLLQSFILHSMNP